MAHIIDGPNTEFAARVLDLRRSKNLTQSELADAVGIDKRSVSMYENGRMFPRADVIRRLAQMFEVEETWLATGASSSTRAFIGNQGVKASSMLPQLEYLYIQPWGLMGTAAGPLPRYQSNDGESDHTRFLPFVRTTLDLLMAAEFPGTTPASPDYPAGTTIVYRANPISLDRLASGTDLVYRLRGAENPVGLRRMVREPGVPQPMLIPVAPGLAAPPLLLDEVDIEVLGVVTARFIRHSF